MELHIHETGTRVEILGTDLAFGQRPQLIVPAKAWQASFPVDGWLLVG